MRNLKVRIWDGKNYHYPEATKDEANHYLQFGSEGFWLYNEKGKMVTASEVGGICEQAIGVKGYKGSWENRRKNEVDLYEGDIVKCMSQGFKGTFEIRFRQCSTPQYILYPAWRDGEFWSIHASDVGRRKGDYFDDLQIIGNIHENKDLL